MDSASTVTPPLAALRCRMQGRRVYLDINERRSISFPASKYDTLGYASQVELEKISLHDEGREVRWQNLDEVIQVEDVAHNRFFHTSKATAASA